MASVPHERERQLVEAARENRVAFGALYEKHVDAIYSYALHRLHDGTAAEEVVSETFHRALENIDRYEWRGVPFSAWLYRIAGNVIAARFRVEPPAPLGEADDVPDDEVGPEESLLSGERRHELRAAVAALPPEQQQAVVLRYGQDLQNKEIAHIMGRSEGAIKQLLHRAMRGLQRHLDEAEGRR